MPFTVAGTTWPMVGRDEELSLLHELVIQHRRSVVLAGPAGVGKSRLATEFLDAIEATGTRTVRVRATRATRTIPFGAFARCLPDGASLPPSRLHLLQAAARSMTEGDDDVVVGIDDAHLLDEGSVALMLHLIDLDTVTVLATVRTDERVSDEMTALWKDELADRVELDSLSETEVVSLLEQSLDGPVSDETVEQLWRLSVGRPLFLRELVRAAVDQGVFARRAGEWVWQGAFPSSDRLTDLLQLRLSAAGPAQREVVERVALGEPLPLDLLASFDAAAVTGAEQAGLITLEESSEGTWVRVGHPLYGELLRATLRPLETRRHLRDLATTAQQLGWAESEPLRTATWLLESGEAIDDPTVFEVAASRALAVRDVHRAARLARVAVTNGGTPGAALTLASAQVAAEHWDEAEEVLEDLLGQPPDDLTLVHAARLQSNLLFYGRGDGRRARQVVAETAGRVSGDLRAWLLAHESNLATFDGDPVAGARLAHAALADAELHAVRVLALGALALGSVQSGNAKAALDAAEEYLPFVLAAFEDDPTASMLGPIHALALSLDGRFHDAAAYAADVLERARRRHVRAYWATPQSVAAWVALQQGRLADAQRLAEAALSTYREENSFGGGDWSAATLATALAQTGDLDAADELLAWLGSHPAMPPIYRAEAERAGAWVSACRGEVSAAQHRATAVADAAAQLEARGVELPALLDVVRFGGARAVGPRLIELTTAMEGGYALAIGAYVTALLAGDGDGLDAASERFEAMGVALLAAEASAEAARAHAAAQRPGRRLSSLARASVLRARCDGASTPALRDLDAHPGLATLTTREREIAELACRLTNRQIAEHLFLSVRTVHTHLQHAYAKLGVSCREDLAELLAATPTS